MLIREPLASTVMPQICHNDEYSYVIAICLTCLHVALRHVIQHECCTVLKCFGKEIQHVYNKTNQYLQLSLCCCGNQHP